MEKTDRVTAKYVNNRVIAEYMASKQISKLQFCKQAHLGSRTIIKALRGDKLSLAVIGKIAAFLNIPVCNLMQEDRHV